MGEEEPHLQGRTDALVWMQDRFARSRHRTGQNLLHPHCNLLPGPSTLLSSDCQIIQQVRRTRLQMSPLCRDPATQPTCRTRTMTGRTHLYGAPTWPSRASPAASETSTRAITQRARRQAVGGKPSTKPFSARCVCSLRTRHLLLDME